MNLTEVIRTTPRPTGKSIRENTWRCLTSAQPGKIVPLCYAPLLRDDRVSRGAARIAVEMMETAETLMNSINVRVYAHFIPFLAFDRFNGLDQLNRSYSGVPETEGGSVVPFFETIAYDRAADIFKVMGIHAKDGALVNSAVVESYNVLVNYRRKARSTKLPLRAKDDTTLAEGFWINPGMSSIVPDFDQAMMDGELDLQINAQSLPVRGVGTFGDVVANQGADDTVEGLDTVYENAISSKASGSVHWIETDASGLPQIYAELQSQGITLSLANIELAKRTAAFAKIRKQYAGLDDDHIIDLLMSGIRVPDAQLAQPILLDRRSTIIGYNRRWATDAANLDKSATTGETAVDVRFRTPPMNTGGIILVTAEIVPEQMYERQKDHFLHITDTAKLPEAVRDDLDPEKVAIVTNDHVDVEHTDPQGTFGYAPLNFEWRRHGPNIGGKFFRQLGDPFVEDRQRLWSVETVDPVLTDDFYLVSDLNTNVFADTVSDPFEITTLGRVEIVGNTVFGKTLEEDTDDYATIDADVDHTRIDQTA